MESEPPHKTSPSGFACSASILLRSSPVPAVITSTEIPAFASNSATIGFMNSTGCGQYTTNFLMPYFWSPVRDWWGLI